MRFATITALTLLSFALFGSQTRAAEVSHDQWSAAQWKSWVLQLKHLNTELEARIKRRDSRDRARCAHRPFKRVCAAGYDMADAKSHGR